MVRRQTNEVDVTFEINALGLRDDPMSSAAKAPNTYRVVMLGDSFVLGYTVDRDHLFVDHLNRVWTAEKRRVDVINAGTEGYSTDQEVLWYLEHGVDFDADLVMLFPYENDIYWNGQTDYHGREKPRFSPDGTLETGVKGSVFAGVGEDPVVSKASGVVAVGEDPVVSKASGVVAVGEEPVVSKASVFSVVGDEPVVS